MGLGDVKGASDRDEGVIVSRSLEGVEDGVRFSYVVRPALGGRIAIRDDIGDAVSVTLESDTEPASMDLSDGTVDFELPIDAGVRERVALIVHDLTVEDLSIAEPTVERLETDESDAERPSGVFGRLGGLLGGSGAESDADEDQGDGGADPLDVAALEALSDDVPETPADVIEGATAEEAEPTDDGATESPTAPDADADSESDADATSETDDGDSANDDRLDSATVSDESTPLESAVEDAVGESDEESAAPDASASAEGGEEPDSAGAAAGGVPTLGETPGDEIDLDIPDAPEEAGAADQTEPSVPEADDSALAELVDELDGEDAAAHRAALLEALGLSGVRSEDVAEIRERQLAIRDAVEDLRTQARETRQKQSELETQLEDVDDVVEAIRDEVSTLHRGCSVLEEEVTGFSDRLTALEGGMEDVDELREDVERAESQREQLTEGIKAVDDRIDDFGDQKARLQERLDRLESTIQDLEAFRSSLARAFDQTGVGGQGGTRPGGPGGR